MSNQKQNQWQSRIVLLLGFGIFVVFAWTIWLLFEYFVVFLEKANPSVSAAIIGGMTTVMAGIIVAVLTQRQIKNRELDEAHREKKVEIYHRFLEVIAQTILKKNPNVSIKVLSDKELINYIVSFKTDLILWGSPKVINALLKFEHSSKNREDSVLLVVDELYRAIREDIGLSNHGLKQNQLIKIFLTDPEEADKLSKVR